MHGTILVDDVVASVFNADGGMKSATSHALLAPLRAWYRVHQPSYTALHEYIAATVLWLNDVPLNTILARAS